MKTRHYRYFVVPTIWVVAVAVVVCLALIAYWKRPVPMLKDASKLISAVRAYSMDKVKKGQAVPDTMPLSELVKGGFITAEDVRTFDGMDVTFYLTIDATNPQEVLIRVKLPDGEQMVVLVDGSVKQLPK